MIIDSGATPQGSLSKAHDFEGALDLKSSIFERVIGPVPWKRNPRLTMSI